MRKGEEKVGSLLRTSISLEKKGGKEEEKKEEKLARERPSVEGKEERRGKKKRPVLPNPSALLVCQGTKGRRERKT